MSPRGAVLVAAAALCACQGSNGAPAPAGPGYRRVQLPTGPSPGVLAAADLNGDGRPELVAANESGSVSVFLNMGGGRFAAAPGSPFAAGQEPNDLAIADFDGDRRPDLAFANHDAQTLTILLGDGQGGFAAGSPVPVRSRPHPHGIAAADLDRDGRTDLVIDSWGDDELVLLRGDGHGGFAEWRRVRVGRHPYQRPRIADVNDDGWPDLLAANLDSKDLTVLLGGPLGFAPAPGSPFAAGDGPFGQIAGDFDGDGRTDIAVLNAPGSAMMSGCDGITILLGDGQGRFAAGAAALDTGAGPNLMAAGDLDRDGGDELVVSRPDSDEIIVFTLGPKGAVKHQESIPVGKGAKGVAIADLDGDGRNDLAVTLEGAAKLVLLLTR